MVRLDAISADRRYEHPEAVTFSTSTTLAAFEFSGTNQKTRPDGMVYRYRLKGHDAAWTTTRRHRVEYERIPRGEYVFEVQGVDRDLIYSETPAQVLVTVRLPYERFAWMGLLVLSAFMIGWQAVRLVSRDRRLRQEMAERERAEAERAKLDVELHEYQYLYRLRTALGESRTLDRVADAVGTCLMDVLKAGGSGGVRIRLDDRTWEYGDPEGRYSYQRELKWGETPRGTLEVSASAALLEPQQKALLDETAGQLCTVLEAREYEMQLLQSSRLISLGEMASAVAHEFNQPLSAISTTVGDIYLRIVEGTRLPQEQLKGMMVNALNLVRRLSDTVDHLRMFSRDSSEEALAAVSLNKAIEGACSIISAQLAARGHSCRLDVQENLPPVRGNLHQLEQVFLNLLANARDALDERYGGGGGRIEAVTRFDGDVVAEVRDDGIGMTADQARRIFDPFYTTKGPDRGTGLGLSITYSIIRTHKGSISCDTEPGMGTRFTIRLPPAGEV